VKPVWTIWSATGRLLGLATLLLALATRLPAQEPDQLRYSIDPADKAACQRQLNILYGAIREYRKEHGNNPPNKLSDLAPDYLHNPDVLICPFVRNRGGLRIWKKRFRDLAQDPHTSYSYEFSLEPLDHYHWRGVPRKTLREYKERQLEEVGPVVPIVRCHDHRPWLNLAFGGSIYESDTVYWEKNISPDDRLLIVANWFPVPPAARPLVAANFPPRDPRARAGLLDLTGVYNATLTDSWQGFPGNHLGSLPSGIHEFDGVQFDVRGVIQLRGTEIPAEFPKQVDGIKVGQKCARIHFLQAVSFPYGSRNAQACYVIHYADRRVHEFPVIYGQHFADWWNDPANPESTDAKVAWTGQNEAAKAYGMALRLFHAVWENPLKDTEVATITLEVTAKENLAGPFVVAITLE